MKTKIKRHSRSVLSVILALSMLVSCMMVGLIATDAAKVTKDSAVGGYSAMGTILYDNSLTNWEHVYCFVLKENYAKAYEMTATKNPSVLSYTNSGWTDRAQFFFAPTAISDAINSYSTSNSRSTLTGGSVYTDKINCSNDDASHIFFPASSSGGALTRTYAKVIASGAYDNKLQINPDTTDWSNDEDVMNATSATVRTSRTYTGMAAGTYAVYMANYGSNTGTINKIGTASGCTLVTEGNNLLITITQQSNITISFVDDSDADLDVTATPYAYTVAAEKKYSNDGTNYTETLSAGGDVTITGTNPVTPGGTVTVTAPEISGYEFAQWSVSGGTVTSGEETHRVNATITPSADCTVTAQYKKIHTVTLDSTGNGSLAFHDGSSASVVAGNTVTVDSTPNTGYAVSGWTITGNKSEEVDGVNTVTFKPTGNVTVSATYSAAYTINTSVVDGHGTIAPANGTQVLQNGSYTVTLTPDSGYTVDYFKLDGVNITSRLTEDDSTFTYTVEHATADASYVVKYKALTPKTITASVAKVGDKNPATISSIAVKHGEETTTYSGTTGDTALSNAVAIKGDKVVITYAADATDNAGFAYYQYSSTSGVSRPQHSSENHTVTFTMPDAAVAARLNFDEVNDIIYLTDAANWGTVKLYISSQDSDSSGQWCSTIGETPVLPKSDDYSEVMYTFGNDGNASKTIYVKYDSDKELYLIKGLSKENSGTMPYIRFYKATDTEKKTNRVQAIANTLYKTVDGADPVKTAAGSFNYDDYEPEHEPEIVWPPTGITANDSAGSAVFMYRFCNSDEDFYSGSRSTINLKYNNSEDYWWADLTSTESGFGLSNLYTADTNLFFSISNNGSNLSGIWRNTNEVLYDNSNGNGLNIANKNANGGGQGTKYYFAGIGKVSSSYVRVGIKIEKVTRTNYTPNYDTFKYTIYTVKSSGGGSTSPTVKVWAKDGTIRNDYSIYDSKAVTTLTDSDYSGDAKSYVDGTGTAYDHSRYHNQYDYAPAVPKGSTIYFKTQMSSDNLSGADRSSFSANYYLKGYCINGVCYQLHTADDGGSPGLYQESFKIPEDWAYDYVEITPIYWRNDSSNCITLYVQGYDDKVKKAGWGNTIGVYPFYQYSNNTGAHNVNNAYGGYPGQPFVNYNGEYFAQLPATYGSLSIKGVTFSNMFWDTIHRSTGEVSKHFQTYDYDDLYKIYKEGVAGNLKDTSGNTHEGVCPQYVICSFKYRTKKNNDEPSTVDVSKYATGTGNGWEYLTDYYGNIVDIFGNKIMNGDTAYTVDTISGYSGNKVHVISQDYRHNCAGKYATEWAVYNNSNQKVTTIVPSALIIRPSADTEEAIETAFNKYDSQTKAFINNYKLLKGITPTRAVATDVTGQPVLITYEKSIWGGADQADRCDARWYWSYEDSSSIKAKIKVQYSEDQGRTWNDDNFTADPSTDGVTSTLGATAKFTADQDNETLEGTTYVTQTKGVQVNKANNFEFQAVNAISKTGYTDYSFYGWAVERDGVIQEFSSKGNLVSGYYNQTSPKSSGATFIARYIKQPTSGEFTIYHDQHPQSTGKGTVTVQVYEESSATSTNGTLKYSNTSSGYDSGAVVSIPASADIIKSNSNKYLRVVFSNTPRGDSEIDPDDAFYSDANTLLTTAHSKGSDYISSVSIDKTNRTFTVVYNIAKMFSGSAQTVFSDSYMTKFKASSKIEYQIDYAFKTRAYGDKDYTVTGTLTEEDIANYFSDQMATEEGITTLTESFVAGKKPEESNFMQNFKWETEKVKFLPTVAGLLRAQLVATQEDVDIINGVIYDPAGTGNTYNVETHYKEPFYLNGRYEGEGDNRKWVGNYITSANPDYLLYWEIFKLDDYEKAEETFVEPAGETQEQRTARLEKRAQLRVAQCYSLDFNYLGFEDYYIRAVYSNTKQDPGARQEASNSLKKAYGSKLLISRNHWNNNVVRDENKTVILNGDGSFTINDNNDSEGTYDKANTEFDRLYVDFVVAYDINGLKGPKIASEFNPRVKIEKVVDGTVVGTGYYNISGLDNKGRVEIGYGINGLEASNIAKGTIFRFTPELGDGKTLDGFTSTSFEVDLYEFLNGAE